MTLATDAPAVEDAGLPGAVRWQDDVDSTTDHPSLAPTVGWTCTWETGPDAGGSVAVGGERLLIGRAAGAGVRCDDAALEPHHALLVPDGDDLRLVQLTGRTPITVGGQPIDAGVVLESPALVEIGHSTLRLRRQSIVARPAAHVRDGVVLRTPRAVPEWAPLPLASPGDEVTEHGRPGGLVPALVGIAAAGVLALVLHQPMFLVFGALGGVVALASWLSQRAGFARRRRRSRRELDRDRAALQTASAELAARYVAHLAEHTSTTASAMATITARDERLWSRRADHRDAFVVSFGVGDLAWRPPIEGADHQAPMLHVAGHADGPVGSFGTTWLHDQPVTLDLAPGARLAIRGEPAHTTAVARAVLLQLAANCGPADVRLLVVTDRPESWAWFAALPHAASPDGSPLLATPTDVGDQIAALDLIGGPPLVVTTDIPELLASRTSVLRRLVGAAESRVALVVLVGAERATPAVCTAELTCPTTARASTQGRARWIADLTSSTLPSAVRVAGIGPAAAARAVDALRGLTDPDDPYGASSQLPERVSLAELLAASGPLTAGGIVARWRHDGSDHPRTPIGVAADGTVDLDLVRDGPHGLLAGTTGSGKSELLRSLVAGMAVHTEPSRLSFVLVDYKGGATFDACAELPHVVGTVTDLDDHLADRALRSLHAELRRRERILRDHGATDLPALRELAPDVTLARLVVVIDEFAALVAEQPAFLHALVGVAQRGRSLGIHLLLATQRPAGVISDDIRANTNIRGALRLQDSADAVDVVGIATPTTFPRRLAGRAVLRLGPEEHVTFQTAGCTIPGDGPTELATIVRAVVDAHRLTGGDRPAAPWCPPLPAQLAAGEPSLGDDEPTDGLLGLIDDPDHQIQVALRWTADGGHLLIGGGHGSGVTSALVAIGTAALDADRTTHLYVIDGRGDAALASLGNHPRCAGVVRAHDRERLRRLLLRLAGEVESRGADSAAAPPIVLLVDGFTRLRTDLGEPDTQVELAALDEIVANGAGGGVIAVLAVEQPSVVPPSVLARCPRRWLGHVADALEATAWGLTAGDVPPPIPGRMAVAPGLQAQLIHTVPRPHLSLASSTHAAPPIVALPSDVDAAVLGPPRRDGAGTMALPVGLGFDLAAPVTLDVPDGEHVLILGPARSGRTTALRRIVTAWSELHPHGWVGSLAPRRGGRSTHADLAGLLGDVPADGPVLIAVDDAELVPDVADPVSLADLAAARRSGLTVVATGKPDALRQSYGHWTSVVRRSRLGLVLAACGDLDGDLLAAALPRRRPLAPRPGLAWLVADGDARLAQLAADRSGP